MVTIKKYIQLVILLILLGACAKDITQEDILTQLSSEYTSSYKPPGLSISIIKEGKPYWSYSYGFSDIEKKTPFHTATIMNIASVSKTITSTAILKLWENGTLDINADINEYLDFPIRNPNYPNTKITVKQLLTHTSSIKDSQFYQQSYQCGEAKITLSEWITNYFTEANHRNDEEYNFHSWKPGEGYKYSNIAFGLLGMIAENVSQTSFDAYCIEHIFNPLQMKNSSWFRKNLDSSKLTKQYAMASSDNEQSDFVSKLIDKEVHSYFELCDYSFPNYPDGLLKTSIDDLSVFMMTIMNNGKSSNYQLLKPSTLKEMLTLQVKDYDVQGLGFKKINYENFSIWGHSGKDPGVRTHMYFNTKTQIGIIIFQNNDEGNTMDLVEKIYTRLITND